ncbi:MAG: hypothetical protein HC806_08695 [Anaerolineae bacterium]|nr:hypothetical protein [Anaerolineae bacterium]
MGPEIVFFDCHFGDNPYKIALRPEGGIFTDYITFNSEDFIDSEEDCDSTTLWGVELEFSDFFADPTGIIVDAIKFVSLSSNGILQPEGDPAMAAVIWNPPFNISLPLIFHP